MNPPHLSLEQQRHIFKQQRFIAMPLAGMLVWAAIGLVAAFVDEFVMTWILFIGTGSIFYLGSGLSYLTGERFFAKERVNTDFDKLFYVGMAMSLMVFAIALPVAAIDSATVPLSLDILTGLMWMTWFWAAEHWVGYFHAIARTVGIVAVWYLFPDSRVEAISAVIVSVYMISLLVLEDRYRTTVLLHGRSEGEA